MTLTRNYDAWRLSGPEDGPCCSCNDTGANTCPECDGFGCPNCDDEGTIPCPRGCGVLRALGVHHD